MATSESFSLFVVGVIHFVTKTKGKKPTRLATGRLRDKKNVILKSENGVHQLFLG